MYVDLHSEFTGFFFFQVFLWSFVC